jgi:hypothetical protein
MRIIGQRGPRLAASVDEWWALYAEPNLEPATLRTYRRWVWEQHARPHLGGLRLHDVTPLVIARFRAEREAAGAGVETIRKSHTMLGSVFSSAVEWQLCRSQSRPRGAQAAGDRHTRGGHRRTGAGRGDARFVARRRP